MPAVATSADGSAWQMTTATVAEGMSAHLTLLTASTECVERPAAKTLIAEIALGTHATVTEFASLLVGCVMLRIFYYYNYGANLTVGPPRHGHHGRGPPPLCNAANPCSSPNDVCVSNTCRRACQSDSECDRKPDSVCSTGLVDGASRICGKACTSDGDCNRCPGATCGNGICQKPGSPKIFVAKLRRSLKCVCPISSFPNMRCFK